MREPSNLAANRGLIVVALVVLLAVGGAIAFILSGAGRPTATSVPASDTAASASPPPLAQTTLMPTKTRQPTGRPSDEATPAPTTSPTPPPARAVEMPFVPVIEFWSTERSISMTELSNGVGGRFPVIALAEDVPALEAALARSGIEGVSAQELPARIQSGALGLLRATDVTPRFNVLAIDGVSLFGVDRVTDIAEWPLRAVVQSSESWDQSASWTWVAAGDVMMDRGVALAVKEHSGNGDYLFDGGTARITGIRCCSFYDFPVPKTQLTGNRGAVRELFSSADVATANLESAVLVDAPYHAHGFTFTADASLLDAVDRAGFDYLSLGNNHVRNAGPRGIRTATEELDARGIAHSGAGDESDAGEPGYVDVNGLTVAIISCDAIVPSWTAGPDKVGTFNCKKSDVAGRIREVRSTADVVAVYPHWGREYKPEPVTYQRRLAYEWIDAGADLVIGTHSHIAGAMEDVDGHVVFYSLGNFIFDQDFRQSTMMGVVPEMAFNGNRLVQIELHATLIIDAQPNLISAEDGGRFVFEQMREGSRGLQTTRRMPSRPSSRSR